MRYGLLRLLDVEKPGRYEGLEAGAIVKDWDSTPLRVALCFPDTYEIGMSHLGLPLLYAALNERGDTLAERAFAPWRDMEALLLREGLPLVTRESGRPLADFDLVGFTLQYELSATNVLCMLELGRVPLLAADRGEMDPIVLGGGPVAANPEPLADFFDAFFIGEGEEAVGEIAETLADAKRDGRSRAERLQALSLVEGIYLPGRTRPRYEGERFAGFEEGTPVRRRLVADLDAAARPRTPILPFISPVHDRLAVEVARGCTRGCRYCQAGYLYRPVRERDPAALLEEVASGLAASGHEEVGLLSLSTGDYSCIGPLIVNLMDAHEAGHVSVSLPSLRLDSLDERLLSEVARVRKTGFTLAPEAGTERLRRAINKNFGDAEILEAVGKIFEAGWKGVKLYFMVGLPFETEEDRRAIADLARAIARMAPGARGNVTVSISNFVPKPHTPFQWAAQLDAARTREIQAFFRSALRDRKIKLKLHDAAMSELEGVLSRGDRRLGRAVLAAYRKGCRMDGWTSEFDPAKWSEALAEAGIEPSFHLAAREPDAPLPWDLVETGVDRGYLLEEWLKAETLAATPDCRDGSCTRCGLCDFSVVGPKRAPPLAYPPPLPELSAEAAPFDPGTAPRLRFLFEKTGAAALLSHLETTAALRRAFRAAGVEILYSRGFNPHPKMHLGPALALGTESLCESGELRLTAVPNLARAQEAANRFLPEGLRVRSLWILTPETAALTGGNTEEEFEVTPSPAAEEAVLAAGGWESAVARFWASSDFPVVKRRPTKGDRVLDARRYVHGLAMRGERLWMMSSRDADGATVAPELFVQTLAGLPPDVRSCARVLKIRSRLL